MQLAGSRSYNVRSGAHFAAEAGAHRHGISGQRCQGDRAALPHARSGQDSGEAGRPLWGVRSAGYLGAVQVSLRDPF